MATATCRDCGRHITWAKDLKGKNIPLQRIDAIELAWNRESLGEHSDYKRTYQATAMPIIDKEIYIAHFKICPGAKKS